MRPAELFEAASENPGSIMVVTKAGTLYTLDRDTTLSRAKNADPDINGYMLGYPVNAPTGYPKVHRWLKVANLRIAEACDQVNI